MEKQPPTIYLRPLTIDDTSEEYLSWLNDPVVTKYIETKKSTMQELIAYVREHTDKADCRILGIFVHASHKLIGTIKFEPIQWDEGVAQFAMMIGDRDYWGKGLGTLSTRLAVEYAFNDLKLKLIKLGVIADNEAAIRAYHRVGFHDIDTSRVVVRADGSRHPAIDMILTREEFESSGGTEQL